MLLWTTTNCSLDHPEIRLIQTDHGAQRLAAAAAAAAATASAAASSSSSSSSSFSSFNVSKSFSPSAPLKLRILYEISSIDRGEKIVLGSRQPWKQGATALGKLSSILELAAEARSFCHFGHSVTLALITAWALEPEERQLILEELEGCAEPIPLLVLDHYNRSLKGAFSHKHRLLLNEQIDNFDLFVHVEDDVRMRMDNVHAFLEHSQRLRSLQLEHDFFLGFSRYEVNLTGGRSSADPDAHFIWEPPISISHFKIVLIANQPYLEFNGGNPHQACWVATREQILELNATCQTPFVLEKADDSASWVEFWSGAMQIFQGNCKRKKLMPLLDFDRFTVEHLTNNKLTYAHIQENTMSTRKFLQTIMKENPQSSWKTIE